MLELPAIRAVIVGINDYEGLDSLKTAEDDAHRIHDYLKDKVQAPEKDLKLLVNKEATAKNIIDTIRSVGENAARNDPILFFFSGYAASSVIDGDEGKNGAKAATLCSVDVQQTGGIVDSTLSDLFDEISKSCGNNITVFLDCTSDIFNWNNPTSFVLVAPDTAKDSADGGTFTKAMLKVFTGKSDLVKSMTVEAFAGHVQAEMDGVEVRSFGANVNRPLFDVKGEKSHHAFIPGRTLSDRVALSIGAAQGVKVGAVYGIYPSNIKGLPKLGNLKVGALDGNGRTATFIDDEIFKNIPKFFYAVEEDGYFDPIEIFVTGSGGTRAKANPLDEYSGWRKATECNAVMTAEVKGSAVSLRWNGFAGDKPKIVQDSFDRTFEDRNNIQREIRRAARFHHLVGAPSPKLSSISSGLRIRFGKVGVEKDNILDSDNFGGMKLAKLDVKREEVLGPYCLTIENKNTHPVWPYAFICDPDGFMIRSWYTPPAGILKPPLQENETLVIGDQTDTNTLMFSYGDGRTRDYTYLKVFSTKERMDFTAFQQWFTSETEDELRGHFRFKTSSSSTTNNDSRSPGKEEETSEKIHVAPWTSMRITILTVFADSHADMSSDSVDLKAEPGVIDVAETMVSNVPVSVK